MATIPVYRQQVVPNAPGPQARASGRDPIGSVLQSAGEDAVRAGEALERQVRVRADENARAWTSTAISGAHVQWAKRVAELEEAAQPGGAGFTDSLLSEFDKYRTDSIANAPDEGSKRFLGERLDAMRASLAGQAVGFEARQRTTYRLQQANDSINNVTTVAAVDPAQAKTAYSEQAAIFSGYENKALAQHLIGGMREKTALAAVSGLVERDPAAGLSLIDKRLSSDGTEVLSGKEEAAEEFWVNRLDGERLTALRHRAASYVVQAENRQRADMEKRLREAEAATRRLQEFTLTGAMVSPDYENEVRAATAGTPLEPAAKALITQSYAGAAFGSQPIPAQRQALRTLEAQTATQGSDPRTQELVAQARAINHTQEEAYSENPWAAATRFARLPATPVMQIPSAEVVPDLIRQRIPSMTAIEVRAGRDVPPLQPEETRQFLDKLAPLDPSGKAEVLSQAGGQLTAGRINAWAADMEKSNRPMALAMKLGYDRTTAGRTTAELVLRGAQALADKTVKKDDAAMTGWRSEISGLVRGSLGDTRAEDDVIEAAYLVRAAMDDGSATAPGFGQDASNERAVRLVVGQPITRAGVKTVLPRGMDEGVFESKIRAYTPEALRQVVPSGKVYIRGQERSVDQLSSTLFNMGFKRDGAGRYVPSSGGAFVTVDKDGQIPLALEFR